MSQHLGAEIKKVLKQRGMTVSEFARRINKSRENVYNIFTRKSLDLEMLELISTVLSHDFINRSSSKKRGDILTSEPKAAYTKVEREVELLREELIHVRKELQYLRDRILAVEGKKTPKYRK